MYAEHIRAARAMLRMEQSELADLAEVSVPTIKRLEGMDGPITGVRVATLDAIRAAFEQKGVSIEEEEGRIGIEMRVDTHLATKIFYDLPRIFPNTRDWEMHNTDISGFNFLGRDKSNRKLYVVVTSPKKDNLGEVLKGLGEFKELHDQDRVCMIVENAPLDLTAVNGVELKGYPPPKWAEDDELFRPMGKKNT